MGKQVAEKANSESVARHKAEVEAWEEQKRLHAEGKAKQHAAIERKRVSNPRSPAAEPVVKCGYGSSDERTHGKTTDTGRDSADCVGVCS